MRHLLKDTDINHDEQRLILNTARQIKAKPLDFRNKLIGKTVGLFFEKHSLRTRVSSEVACTRLGAHPIALQGRDLQIARGETAYDTARVLGGYLNLIIGRVISHSTLVSFRDCNCLPVVNGLSDHYHPLQALADLMTIEEEFGNDLANLKICYLGDLNNVARSLALSALIRGINVTIACPEKCLSDKSAANELIELAKNSSATLNIIEDPLVGAKDAHVLYTDVWTSMGSEGQESDDLPLFAKYQLNERVLCLASSNAITLHCLPAHRGEEITGGVIEGKSSRIFNQAHNRLPATAAVLLFLLNESNYESV